MTPGTRLGSYEVLALLGAGGMGAVYRARDAKLNREVALKILPETVASDPDRLVRFTREAQTLAALNHPNIGAIYGIEESPTVRALVMELIEGDDLSVLVARGQLPLDEVLNIARQIAEALEAAHDHGIIHRDLKPANIKVRPDGTVKVLDFGLAKALDPTAGSSVSAINSPTLSMHATQAGVILGTAAYMAPEQARGKAVDRRADIWSFGVVLYEMLTGQRAFKGDDVTDTLASVLKDRPAFDALPASTPPRVRWILERCLERDPRARLRDIGEVRVQLAAVARGDADSGVAVGAATLAAQASAGEMQARVDAAVANARRQVFARRVLPLAGLAIFALAALVVAFSRTTAATATPAITRISVTPPEGRILRAVRAMALSPDGNQLAYLTDNQLLIRPLSEFELQPVATVDLGQNLQSPVFSPDGKWIAYYSASERWVKRVSVQGGAALRVCDSLALSLDWDASGILVAQGAGGVVRCNPAGGAPEQLATVDDEETVLGPQMLPDGDGLMFTIRKAPGGAGTQWDQARVVVESLRTKERKTVLEGGSDARFVRTGHLIYAVGGILFAAPFDVKSRELRGPAVSVVEGVGRGSSGTLQLSVSDAGALAYMPGPVRTDQALRGLAFGDRSGMITRLSVPLAAYSHVRVSRDGKRAAIGTDDGKFATVMIYPINGKSTIQRLTVEGNSRFPVWSPDGQWIAFQSDRDGDFGMFRQRADGTGVAERLTTAAAGEAHVPESWSSAGILSFTVRKTSAGRTGLTLWTLLLADKTKSAFAGVMSRGPIGSVFSPDGRWLAYGTTTDGAIADVNRGIFVQPFPPTGSISPVPRQMVDFHPVWSGTGDELVFSAAATAGQMVAIGINTAGAVTFGTPAPFPASVTGDRPA
ncbi:MAG: protein kinase, partial [Vicinamibacterales bacterium]